MRVLSTKLPMVDTFDEKDFYGVIVNWLKNAGPCKTIGINFEAYEDKSKACLEDTYCKLETFVSEKDDCLFYLFKLEQVFHEQTWTTEVILQIKDTSKTVYFHIDCSRDATRFDEVPAIRTDVIRYFVNSGYLKQPDVEITQNPITATDELEAWVASAAREEYMGDMPIVLVTQFFGSMGYAVDEYDLARKLAGIAYIVTCDNEHTRGIKAKAGRTTPFNGTVAIYTSKGKPKIYRQEDVYYGTTLNKQIFSDIQRIVTAKVDADAPTWKSLHHEILKAEAEEKRILLDKAFDENVSLEEQVKRLKSKVSEISEENRVLRSKNETLELALQNGSSSGLLIKAPIEEFYEGEQYDLIVRTMNESLLKRNHEYRDFEILQQLAVVNKEKGLGREIFKVVKKVLSDGHTPRESDLARLRSVGFEIVSQSNHYKLKFRGSEKYWFSLAKTPSDDRAGKNLVSDITKTLSVYK